MYASTFGSDYWKAALDYWRDPTEKSWILVNPASIGDTWCTLALANAFKRVHGGPLTVVVHEGQEAMAQMYSDDIDRLIVWEKQRLMRFCIRLQGAGHFDIDEPIIAHPLWHGAGRTIFPLMERLRQPGKGGLTFADQWRLMLRLPWDSEMRAPRISDDDRAEADRYADQMGVAAGTSVILFPDNNTNPPLPDTVWAALAHALSSKGWKVFTNLAGNSTGGRSEPLRGTHPIAVTVKNAIPLVERAGRYISMANGMQVMLLGSGVKAQHTFLIHDAPLGEKWGSLGYPISDMLMQSSECAGVAPGPFFEYMVNPSTFTHEDIQKIADNDPSAIPRFYLD